VAATFDVYLLDLPSDTPGQRLLRIAGSGLILTLLGALVAGGVLAVQRIRTSRPAR